MQNALSKSIVSCSFNEHHHLSYSIVAHSFVVWFVLLVPAVNSSQTSFTMPGIANAFQKAKGVAWAGWQCCPHDWTQGHVLAGWVRRVSNLLSWALLQSSSAKGTRGSPGSHQAPLLPPDLLQWLGLCHRADKLPEEYPAAPKLPSSSTWMPLLHGTAEEQGHRVHLWKLPEARPSCSLPHSKGTHNAALSRRWGWREWTCNPAEWKPLRQLTLSKQLRTATPTHRLCQVMPKLLAV